ncbi:hypothetical protein [Microbacterium sp. W4I20]|uniref:hypothetical protein n=1 Tax=Microbacterium sp. W4I20 TaxID=3042262 RepID=UPI0027836FD5|nr:hypothetical protein [Microbacterium sp. W4I20]MDQ0729179.1 hypothetical protein [Microbacterium sp. W4I20]
MPDLDPQSESKPTGVTRRTVVQGAAWSIPVIAAAVATPLAAASVADITLEFVNGPYSVLSCGTLGNVVIEATTSTGAPAPVGTTVTVVLPTGMTWSDGSTGARPVVVGANGQATLTGLISTGGVGVSNIIASVGTSTASAPVTVAPNGNVFFSNGGGAPTQVPNVPAGSQTVGQNTYLAPNGDLYYFGNVIATGVTSAHAENIGAGSDWVSYVSNGTAYSGPPSSPTPRSNIPADAVAVGQQTFLTPGGDLYYNNTLVATGVSSAHSENTGPGADWITYVANGTAHYISSSAGVPGAPGNPPGVPTNSTAVGQNAYLAPNGDLVYSYSSPTVVASNVTSAYVQNIGAGSDWATYVSNGVSYYVPLPGGAPTAVAGVPANSVTVGQNTYLAPNGNLYYFGNVVATNVGTAWAQNLAGGSDWISFTTNAAC